MTDPNGKEKENPGLNRDSCIRQIRTTATEEQISIATSSTLKGNDQTQNENKEVDIGEIHAQSTC